MSVDKVAESRRCLEAAPKILKSAQPKSPWAVLEEHGVPEVEVEELIKCPYGPCPEFIRELFFGTAFGRITRIHEDLWRPKVKNGLGLSWIVNMSSYRNRVCSDVKETEDRANYLHKLVARFSESEPMCGGPWLPHLLLHTSTRGGIRADHVCFCDGAYELAIQWALGYLQLDLGWFDSMDRLKFAEPSEVREEIAECFEFAGDYHSAISWRENHNVGSPRDLARLNFLIGNLIEATEQLQRPKSDFGGHDCGNEPSVAKMLSRIKPADEAAFPCRKCGAVLMRHWKLCPECCTPAVLTCKCGEKIESHWTVCPTCGTKLV